MEIGEEGFQKHGGHPRSRRGNFRGYGVGLWKERRKSEKFGVAGGGNCGHGRGNLGHGRGHDHGRLGAFPSLESGGGGSGSRRIGNPNPNPNPKEGSPEREGSCRRVFLAGECIE